MSALFSPANGGVLPVRLSRFIPEQRSNRYVLVQADGQTDPSPNGSDVTTTMPEAERCGLFSQHTVFYY
ncbi:MAG: hypothetical protein HC889_15960 [Synechococcaceae cyanobacterium SM1_2_3]|nr:hypothetical protein [Synechococcaceae cyanobacterium SM1_2_3]